MVIDVDTAGQIEKFSCRAVLLRQPLTRQVCILHHLTGFQPSSHPSVLMLALRQLFGSGIDLPPSTSYSKSEVPLSAQHL